MNKKFWTLIVTGAILAAGATATGCASRNHNGLIPVPAAIETTAETKAAPAQTETAHEEQTAVNEDKVPVAVDTNEIKKASCDGEGFPAIQLNTDDESAKKPVAKKTKKTSKTSSKKTVKKNIVNNEREIIVKAARAAAVKDAEKYQNMDEKIALAKQASAKKAAAQKNADSRKDMNKAAEEAQKAAKTQAEKQHVKKVTQKAESKTAAEKLAKAKKAAAKKAAAEKRKALGSRKHAQKSAARGNKRMKQTIRKRLKNLFYKEITGRNPED